MKLYLYEKCESCRKATRWLDEKKIEYTSIPIRETPPTRKELTFMLSYHGGNMKKLFNTSGKDYRDPIVKKKLSSLSDEEIINLLSNQGNLIKRPFLIGDKVLLQGFKAELWESTFTK
jgi:arsenate reductase